MKRSSHRACALVFAAAIISAGCMLPSYHLPGGFSSTYQRQLYGTEPVAAVSPDPGLAGIETHGGIFYPTTAFRDSPTPRAQKAEAESMEPLLLGSDPLGGQKTAKRSSADTF